MKRADQTHDEIKLCCQMSVILKLDGIFDTSNLKTNIIWTIAIMKVVEEKPHKCPLCNVRFSTVKNIPRHVERIHFKTDEKLRCCICKKLYDTKGNHDAHYRKKHLVEHLLYMKPEKVNSQGSLLKSIYVYDTVICNYIMFNFVHICTH